MPIKSIFARQIYDSRDNPTVEVDLITDLGLFRAAVASGASTGVHEMKTNAILRVSLAVAKAGVAKRKIPLYKHLADLAGNKGIILPVPAFNIINGGSHAGNKLVMQACMILPTGANSFSEAMKMGSEIYHHLMSDIKAKFGLDATAVGDEGGFAPNILNNKDALMMLLPRLVILNLLILVRTLLPLNSLRMVNMISPSKIPSLTNLSAWLYEDFIKNFPIVSIEDPFDQDNWNAWTAITVYQIGTVTESIKAHNLAKANGWGTMVSHRSGETEDTFIADLVVGLATGQIKTGAPCRLERLAKYNQILRIEEELGSVAKFAVLPLISTEETRANFSDFFRLFRTPSKIIHDASRNFTAKIFKNFVEQLGIEIHVTTPGTHRSNGQVELFMGTISNLLRDESRRSTEWPNRLWKVQQVLNTTKHKKAVHPSIVTPKLRETSERQKRMFDIKRRDNQSFDVGDFVLLRPEKFSCEFVRPYRIKSQAAGDRYLPQKVRAQKVLKCSKDLLRVWPTD
ncbi:hypothetical protein ILUMI_17522 [Ignelater luminosus]|uniref:Enolase n=1 Tax=Ignelater luminosus TaxID=2038154 RepID=A0A8K0CN48_IGNLU|nr:hypothetical protein ILUMI_17522 [Ignelater luminosus]